MMYPDVGSAWALERIDIFRAVFGAGSQLDLVLKFYGIPENSCQGAIMYLTV